MTKDMEAVLEAIRNDASAPDDMTDSQIWHAEDQLLALGLIRHDEMTGDLVTR